MKEIYNAFAKKLFGTKYEKLKKILLLYLIVFQGLHASGFQIQISPFILYLMTSTFSAGVMWQLLSSEGNAENMKNLLMLPFEKPSFVFSYISALGAYTLLLRTAGLWAVVLAVSPWNKTVVAGSLLCTVNAILMTSCIFSLKKYRKMGIFWMSSFIMIIFLLWKCTVFYLVTAGNCLLAFLLLANTDAYSFYLQDSQKRQIRKSSSHFLVWHYLLRYLTSHKNYLINTLILWAAASVFPFFWGKTESRLIMPIGFAVLTLNTPICILLSCNPDLEQSLRCLPGQMKAFCIPYCLFIFLCNITADIIFICSWQIKIGGITTAIILTAAFISLQSAVGSTLLEWLFPIRNWKTENDLWHHPRKYIVPLIMLLTAGAVSTLLPS